MTRRKFKTKEPKASRTAKAIGMPDAQVKRGGMVLVDAPNLTTDVHRGEAVAPKQKVLTVRKLTKIEKLYNAKLLTKDEASICEWYHKTHATAYDIRGVTADYGRAGGGGCTNFIPYQGGKAMQAAKREYLFARAGIDPRLVGMFEWVVLHGRPLGQLRRTFRLAIRQLAERMGEMRVAA